MGLTPIVNKLAVGIPLAEIPFLIKTAGDERLTIRSPDAAANWLSKPYKLPFYVTGLVSGQYS